MIYKWRIEETENLFEEVVVEAILDNANPQSAADPSGLRYNLLHEALCEEITGFAMVALSSSIPPQFFWALCMTAILCTLGQKTGPIACGDVFRKVVGSVFSVDTSGNL